MVVFMEQMMKLRAFIGTEEVLYHGRDAKLNKKMQYFMNVVTDPHGNSGKYEIIKEVCSINDLELFYLEAEIPSWSEALFFISYPEYRWDIMEEP